jgi:hypothetical protein
MTSIGISLAIDRLLYSNAERNRKSGPKLARAPFRNVLKNLSENSKPTVTLRARPKKIWGSVIRVAICGAAPKIKAKTIITDVRINEVSPRRYPNSQYLCDATAMRIIIKKREPVTRVAWYALVESPHKNPAIAESFEANPESLAIIKE